jgi:hypothetical protein
MACWCKRISRVDQNVLYSALNEIAIQYLEGQLGKNFIVQSDVYPDNQTGFREELYFQNSDLRQSKIKDLCPVQGRTLLFVNTW